MSLVHSIRKQLQRVRVRRLARLGRDAFAPGSAEWLIVSEGLYGGYSSNVPRGRVSPHDPRSPEELRQGGYVGGDRMSPLHHDYASVYEKHLAPFVRLRDRELTLVELGILRGTGLALWSDLFPRAHILGLDYDLSNFQGNEAFLRSRGAFRAGEVRLAEFDQYEAEAGKVGALLQDRKIDVMIDDGCHADDAILKTFEAFRGHLAERFVYFIEDNGTVLPQLRAQFPGYQYEGRDQLTVVTPR